MTPAAASSGPVFLICSERSGSNLIEHILGAHPDVCALSSVHYGVRLLRHFHYTLPRGGESAAWRALLEWAVSRTGWLRSEAEARRLHAWVSARPQVTAAELARFLYLDLPQAEGKLLFVKDRGLHDWMFFLREIFPQAKFVFQVRDPRDYLLSAQRMPRSMFGSTRQALAAWDQDQRFGLATLGLLGAARVHLQRYEDLVRDPVGTLQALTEFLGIRWDDSMIAFHEMPFAKRRVRDNPVPMQNLDKPLLRENYGKWRQALSASAVKTVEAHLGQLMDRFGYPRQHDPRFAQMHRFKALLLAPVERAANRDLHLWRGERGVEKRLRSFDVEPLLPPVEYPPES